MEFLQLYILALELPKEEFKLKFVIPQNYNLKNKFLGFLNYSTIIVNLVWIFLIFNILSLFSLSFHIQISLTIILCLPLVLFSIFGINNESIFQIILYLLKYFFKTKIYIFYK